MVGSSTAAVLHTLSPTLANKIHGQRQPRSYHPQDVDLDSGSDSLYTGVDGQDVKML